MHFRGSFYDRLQALLDRGKVLTEQVNFAPTMDGLICNEVFKDIGLVGIRNKGEVTIVL